MGLISKIEKQVLDAFEGKLEINTEVVDDEDGLFFVTTTYFDGNEMHTEKVDLEPLVEAIKSRL